jgi:hypothetical protein
VAAAPPPAHLAPVASLYDLMSRLRAYAASELSREDLEAWLAPVLAADPLDVTHSDASPWEDGHDEERLLWRLIYLVESSDPAEDGGDAALRAVAARVVACLADTASPETTLELLPVLVDQGRFCEIVARHRRGVISRTGFLAVIAESGYPAHAKLWLEHAPAPALDLLCARLTAGAYAAAAEMLERPAD